MKVVRTILPILAFLAFMAGLLHLYWFLAYILTPYECAAQEET